MAKAQNTISRRSILSRAALAALALPSLPTFAESFKPDELSFVDLRTIYDGLSMAADSFLAIMNQPRAEQTEISSFFEDWQEAIFLQRDALVELVKARKPLDNYQSELRAEILIRHTVHGMEFKPSQIVELLSDWNPAPTRWNAT